MLDRSDLAFARALATDDHEDATADALAARKAATSLLLELAQRRDDEDKVELTLLARSKLPASARRATGGAQVRRSVYETLLVVSGWRFDVAYVPVTIQRDRLETALARSELRGGRSAALKALARRIVRVRTRETAAFGRA